MPKALPLLDDVSPLCCAPLASTPDFPEEDAVRLAIRLKALADPVRLRLIASLLGQPTREACTCELAPILGVSEPTVSHHLKTLAKAGLVSKERRGMSVFYTPEIDALRALGVAVRFDEIDDRRGLCRA
ncbi:ArsR/SmtB family transcription factor [Microbacterium memoriense]|uniref:Metalloregulator ArsR/SmtB family transcription factor n=1 Tax=Microbacterium memoriense TaxID=2978350 RepID=A0ABT2PAQ8_9MICO|nr:metalloregulator ArsR/SmtB family transcription factor [Microbacterium memoriense]MCT9001667.1 metalloregulator ArsR/SmtB family transcription factor [Microbacterium memoriense]